MRVIDYKLTSIDRARIQCTAPGGLSALSQCTNKAVYGQNRGSAPFWYHCKLHAEMWRATGQVWQKDNDQEKLT